MPSMQEMKIAAAAALTTLSAAAMPARGAGDPPASAGTREVTPAQPVADKFAVGGKDPKAAAVDPKTLSDAELQQAAGKARKDLVTSVFRNQLTIAVATELGKKELDSAAAAVLLVNQVTTQFAATEVNSAAQTEGQIAEMKRAVNRVGGSAALNRGAVEGALGQLTRAEEDAKRNFERTETRVHDRLEKINDEYRDRAGIGGVGTALTNLGRKINPFETKGDIVEPDAAFKAKLEQKESDTASAQADRMVRFNAAKGVDSTAAVSAPTTGSPTLDRTTLLKNLEKDTAARAAQDGDRAIVEGDLTTRPFGPAVVRAIENKIAGMEGAIDQRVRQMGEIEALSSARGATDPVIPRLQGASTQQSVQQGGAAIRDYYRTKESNLNDALRAAEDALKKAKEALGNSGGSKGSGGGGFRIKIGG